MKDRMMSYNGRNIGMYYDDWGATSYLTEFGLQDLLREMPVSDKIHIKTRAPDVLRLVKAFCIPEETYLTDEDLAIYCAIQGYRNQSELNRGDHHAWELIRNRRNLINEIFSAVDEERRDKRK